MKTFKKICAPLLLIWSALLFSNCGGSATEEATDDAAEEAREYSHQTAVGIQHEVADFNKWLEAYNNTSGADARISVYQMNDNPNMVVLFRWTYSHDEAKESLNSEEVKTIMKEAGVIGEPVFTYYDLKYINEATSSMKYRVAISHEVKDYENWKPFFDADQARRDEAGFVLRGLSTNADNPNMVNIMFAADDVSMLDEMMNSEDLKARMDSAGVISRPVVMVLKVPDSN